MMCGGAGAEKDANAEIQSICDEVKDEVLEKSSKDSFEMFTALKYRSQVVAGSNYFVKIQVGDDECVHARIFEPLPCNNDSNKRVFLHGLQEGKKKADPVDYFDASK